MNKKTTRDSYWNELKSLWHQFDPIGVYIGEDPDWPDDEYDSYIDPTFALLSKKATFNELQSYIHYIVTQHMGMEQLNGAYINNFVSKLQTWHLNYKNSIK